MSLKIEHYPNKSFAIFSFTPEFDVNLSKSVRENLSENEQLTNATALKILKEIKLKSDVLSFLTKSIVAFPLSAGILIAGLSFPVIGTVSLIAGIFLGALGGGMFGYCIENSLFLSLMSKAYSDQSERAGEYIKTLETTDHEMQFELEGPRVVPSEMTSTDEGWVRMWP